MTLPEPQPTNIIKMTREAGAPAQPRKPDDSEDSNYLPLSEEEASLGDDDFIILKTHWSRNGSNGGL